MKDAKDVPEIKRLKKELRDFEKRVWKPLFWDLYQIDDGMEIEISDDEDELDNTLEDATKGDAAVILGLRQIIVSARTQGDCQARGRLYGRVAGTMRHPSRLTSIPVLYMLYLAELLNQDQALRFGYADDIALYRIGNTLEENVTAITQDVRRIEAWGLANKVAFAPEKLEMMHFTRRRHAHAPEAVISPTLTIQPTTSAPGDTKQPALRWLGKRYETAISGPVATGSTTPDPIPPALHPRCRTDPTQGIDKETAAASFNDWWNALPPNTVTIFSDGSESYDDAGALKGLQKALTLPSNADTQRWLCIDSTSVIWCKRANASDTSQWAFLESHRLIDRHAVNIRWSPGHQGITGNEAADSLADAGAKSDIVDPGPTAQPTISGIGSIARSLAHNVTSGWWRKNEPTLSGGYRKWQLDYALKEPMELKLSRPTLHRLLALRSRHGDFEA
ncbi:hypothetical protein DID88_002034 [Monilinia fructigena]|uniref:RNase H type-1 domain-containing protein n=1 Tax=Monilinia fructigena TaxID=38457 RepID=A0A395IVG3_9HELO|nr:hypothetical protein DID88_002034 [Monilinia fructigena]